MQIVKNDLQFIEHSVSESVDNGKVEVTINILEGKNIGWKSKYFR